MRKLLYLGWILLFLIPVFTVNAQTEPRRLGTNLASVVDWTTEQPFTDIFKTARPWISQQEGANWGEGGELALTPEGWVASLEEGQFAETILFTADPAYPIGDYILLYDGEGEIAFRNPNATQIVSAEIGRMVINIPQVVDGGIFLQITATNPDNPLRNIHFILPDFEATYQEQIFNPAFLEKTASFSALRFMDWMQTNNSEIIKADERPRVSDATYMWRGVPAEIMVQLANTLQVDAWFNMPHLADDDYIQEFATVVRDNLDPNLKAYIEYSNETWNSQFSQFHYGMEQGNSLGEGDPFLGSLRFHSEQATRIFAIWEDVFGGTERLVRIFAAQAANTWTGEQIIIWQDAYQAGDAIAIAPYFSCAEEGGNPELAQLSVDELLNLQMANVQAGGCAYESIAAYADLAKQYNLDLIAYEGGQHLVGYGGNENNEALTNLFIEANRHPRMGEIYLAYLQNWHELGGGLFMHFTDVESPSKFGNWGALENIGQTSSPKYDALMAYLDQN